MRHKHKNAGDFCIKCSTGTYQEMGPHDYFNYVLHCIDCNHKVKVK